MISFPFRQTTWHWQGQCCYPLLRGINWCTEKRNENWDASWVMECSSSCDLPGYLSPVTTHQPYRMDGTDRRLQSVFPTTRQRVRQESHGHDMFKDKKLNFSLPNTGPSTTRENWEKVKVKARPRGFGCPQVHTQICFNSAFSLHSPK